MARRLLAYAAAAILIVTLGLTLGGEIKKRALPVAFIAQATAAPVSMALQAELAQAPLDDPVAAFYRGRRHRPLWVEKNGLRPEAVTLLTTISTADRDGLAPQDYHPQTVRSLIATAASGRADDLARAEAALSRAYASYIVDLREPPEAARPVFVDPELDRPRLTRRAALEALAGAPTLTEGLETAEAMNLIYLQLRQALAAHRVRNPRSSSAERLILANLARARALPQDLGRRFVLVDVAAAKLWAYQDGQVRDSMDVVVGKPSQPTPAMIGLMRYAVFNPYWNVPNDLARDTFAPRVLRRGASYLKAERMEALSDWTAEARILDSEEIDWAAVAAGRQALRLRQEPGPHNTMGAVKLMLPNRLGIYLHDTPMKHLFAQSQRTASAGCVRLADAMRLTRWLFGRDVQAPSDQAEQRIDLPEPVPVYITYFTAAPGADGVEFRTDIYGRDEALLAELQAGAPRPMARAGGPQATPPSGPSGGASPIWGRFRPGASA